MNKYIVAFAVFAAVFGSLAANPVASPDSEVDQLLSEMEIDEGYSEAGVDNGFDEAADLPEEHLYFRDYCLNAQGTIKNYVSEKLNGAAANIYSIMLTSATDIGREVLTAQKASVTEGTKLIEQAQAENGGAATEEQVEETLQKAGIFQRVTAAVRNVITAILETARATLFARIQELKEQLGSEGLRQKIEDACSSISNELQPRLNKQLTEAKSQIKSAATPDNEAKLTTILTGARVDNIGCTLTGRISKVAKFCDILKVAGPTVYQLVGIN